MTESKDKEEKEEKKDRKGWEELIFSTIEKIAATPGKFKDPGSAFEWVKTIREDVQERIREEVSQRIGKLDWNLLARKLGDHLAEKYRLRIEASIEWQPKEDLKDFSVKAEKKETDSDE